MSRSRLPFRFGAYFLAHLISAAALVSLLGSAHATSATLAEPCASDATAALTKARGGRLSPSDQQELARWCQSATAADAKAVRERSRTQRESAGKGAPTSPASTNVAAPHTNPAIWCAKKFCTCWKGNVYDGCQHVEKLCAGPLTCGPKGHACACSTGG